MFMGAWKAVHDKQCCAHTARLTVWLILRCFSVFRFDFVGPFTGDVISDLAISHFCSSFYIVSSSVRIRSESYRVPLR
jgi:hypothetical protein